MLLVCTWLAGGLALARCALGLRRGLEVAALALPLGVLAHVLAANALGYVMPLPLAILLALVLQLGAALLALGRSAPAALEWELGRRARLGLFGLALLLGLGVWELGSLEVFGDDGGHASMAHLLAAGQFPLRFQCNPALRASYSYGGDLLAASVMVVADAAPFEALDLARAASVTSALLLAFLAGFRPRRSLGAGLLAAFLLVTVGPMVWVFLPFARGGLAEWAQAEPGLAPMVASMTRLLDDPWRYGMVTPGFITTTYAHAQRALAWGFAPFQALLFLALLECDAPRRRKSVALGLALGATPLMQAGILVLLLSGFGSYVAWSWLRRRRDAAGRLDFDVAVVLGLALLMALALGGPLTDSLLDRFAGVENPTTGFHFDPLRLPSCRGREITATCVLLSAGNLGLAPFLLPWAVVALLRGGPRPRLALVFGCAVAYVFPFLFRYDYIDWNIQRILTYASWVLAVVLAPLLFERLRAGGAARRLAAFALLLMAWQGTMALGVVVDGTWLKDRVERKFFAIHALDERMMRYAPALPRGALLLDPVRCLSGTACRAAILFGRYAGYSRDRLHYQQPTDGYVEALRDPRAATLRRHGYTHLYVDGGWLHGLPPDIRARLAGDAYQLIGAEHDERDLRLLLRVCAPDERCALSVPGAI